MLLNWDDGWTLNEKLCPCDLDFLAWVAENNFRDQKIFHMGTGMHHIVGKTLAESNSNNFITGITACPQEYKEYMQLIIDEPNIAWTYKPLFGDIYQIDPRQFSSFNIVTFFHLYEFTNEIRTLGPGLTNEEVVKIFFDLVEPNGYMLTYTRSAGYINTSGIFLDLESKGLISLHEDFMSLRVWRKL